MAREWKPVEVWLATPYKIDFCPPIYPMRHIYFLWKEKEHLQTLFFVCLFVCFVWFGLVWFCCGKGQKWRRLLRSLPLYLFLFFLESRLWKLLNQKTFEISVPLTLFIPLRADCRTFSTRSTWCLTNTLQPKIESSTFWCLSWGMQDLSQTQLKKEVHCCLE
jgi:hypothetical protein